MTPRRKLIQLTCSLLRDRAVERGVAFPKYRWLKRLVKSAVEHVAELQARATIRRL